MEDVLKLDVAQYFEKQQTLVGSVFSPVQIVIFFVKFILFSFVRNTRYVPILFRALVELGKLI